MLPPIAPTPERMCTMVLRKIFGRCPRDMQAPCRREVSWCTTTSSFAASHLSILDGWGARTTNEAPPMTTTTFPRTRIALRLLSAAFLVTALLASGGTASAAKKKAQSKAPAASQEETPPPPAAAAPAEETPAPPAAGDSGSGAGNSGPGRGASAGRGAGCGARGGCQPAAAPAAAATQPEAGAASPQRKRAGKTVELGLSPQRHPRRLTISRPARGDRGARRGLGLQVPRLLPRPHAPEHGY